MIPGLNADYIHEGEKLLKKDKVVHLFVTEICFLRAVFVESKRYNEFLFNRRYLRPIETLVILYHTFDTANERFSE